MYSRKCDACGGDYFGDRECSSGSFCPRWLLGAGSRHKMRREVLSHLGGSQRHHRRQERSTQNLMREQTPGVQPSMEAPIPAEKKMPRKTKKETSAVILLTEAAATPLPESPRSQSQLSAEDEVGSELSWAILEVQQESPCPGQSSKVEPREEVLQRWKVLYLQSLWVAQDM